MRVYRISFTHRDDSSHGGYKFASSRSEARRMAAINPDDHETEIDTIEVALTKAGILRALNIHAGHPDNG